ncbi:early light-induced protein 1, chloroplastic-like [Durio zibethinus]|uniref:Early light-induced protein 1, chloroplastic-like n=1 Tax=Durio zibethinus TaxID=66656 RepID=A0A6P6A7H6_DURZI|nr:early light-induced protein 1, chloroplastic-like [Durio zibethinus]
MAASVAMQLLLASPLTTSLTNRNRVIQFFPVRHVPRLKRNANVCICCSAEEYVEEYLASRKSFDVLSRGEVAERINGRLAMIGFVAAMAVELSKGQDLFTQISDGGIPWLLGTSIVIAVASSIPLLKGVTVESSSVGILTSDAELWNGRFAMSGFLALAFAEYLKGGTLF